MGELMSKPGGVKKTCIQDTKTNGIVSTNVIVPESNQNDQHNSANRLQIQQLIV